MTVDCIFRATSTYDGLHTYLCKHGYKWNYIFSAHVFIIDCHGVKQWWHNTSLSDICISYYQRVIISLLRHHPVIRRYPMLSRQPVIRRHPVVNRHPVIRRHPVMTRHFRHPLTRRHLELYRHPVISRQRVIRRYPVISRQPVMGCHLLIRRHPVPHLALLQGLLLLCYWLRL